MPGAGSRAGAGAGLVPGISQDPGLLFILLLGLSVLFMSWSLGIQGESEGELRGCSSS